MLWDIISIMKWDDLERSAKEYAQTFPEGMTEPTFEFTCSEIRGSLMVLPKARLSAAHKDMPSLFSDMAGLNVQEVLEMLLQEKWKYGVIGGYKSSSSPMVGLHISSPPYPVFSVEGNGKKTRLKLTEEQTALNVRIYPSQFEGINAVHFADDHTYDLAHHLNEPILDALDEYGWNKGLRESFSAALPRQISRKTIVSASNVPAFHWGIYKHITEREQHKSMPLDLIEWSNHTIGQLPENLQAELKQEKTLKAEDLRMWGHRLNDNSTVVRIMDKIWPWGFGL